VEEGVQPAKYREGLVQGRQRTAKKKWRPKWLSSKNVRTNLRPWIWKEIQKQRRPSGAARTP
jgi:hypothetical protein